jgi:hypothetical protein
MARDYLAIYHALPGARIVAAPLRRQGFEPGLHVLA